MTNALADPPGIGHNLPPLGEQLAEELAAPKARADALLEVAATAVIVDDESAAKVIDLGQLIAALEKDLDAARTERKRPFLEAGRAIDTAYGGIIGGLMACRQGLRGMLTAYNHKRAAEAEAARQVALAEQRQREEEAAAAQERARQTTNVTDALASLKAQEEAAAAARRAEAIRPEPIRAQLGSLGARREIAFDITDMRKLLQWIVRQPMKTNLEAEVRKLMGAYLRQLGVDAVARGVDIPGMSVWIDTQAAIRR